MIKKFLKEQKGEVAIAILVSLLALMSGLSLSMVAARDANAAVFQLDQVQELSLVRSELRRGPAYAANQSTGTNTLILPTRYIQIQSGGARTTYAMKTRVGSEIIPSGLTHSTRRGVQTKVKAFRRVASQTHYSGTKDKSPIESYGLKYMQKSTFAGYMYLTNTDESVNGDEVYFYGYDEIWGRVHSNSDIQLKNVGGWPLFHDHVYTTGHIVYTGGNPNPEDVFLDGYTEETGEIDFNPTATLIRQNGGTMWPDYDIAFVELLERDYQVLLATFERGSPDTLIVYNMYPPFGPVGDSLGMNRITFIDTIWHAGGSGSIEGSSRMVESGELWICGTCRGAQTWGSAGNMKLVDDILYANTEKGDAPDGFNGEAVNVEDYLGLVSERQIIIQYALFDPRDSLRHHYNCDGDDEGIWIYGALAAIGDGDGDYHQDGIFTFEYQYPHQSTPNTWYNGEYFDYIDLHLNYYPPFEFNPFPYPNGQYGDDPQGPDYPWYNPIWPENRPYDERGKIHIYGSLAQSRRGFVHRSGNDPLDCGPWDLENYMYHPLSGWPLMAPGADGSGSGYDKDYHYDYRFMENPPPDFPEVNNGGKEGDFNDISIRFQRPPAYF